MSDKTGAMTAEKGSAGTPVEKPSMQSKKVTRFTGLPAFSHSTFRSDDDLNVRIMSKLFWSGYNKTTGVCFFFLLI